MAIHKFRGKDFTVTYRKRMPKGEESNLGTTHGSRIRIKAGQIGLERLDTEIHEALHACLPDLDEAAVTETASDIARFLWGLGYTRS